MSCKALLEILMRATNPDADKSVVVDIEFDSEEIDETFDEIRKDQLPLRKRIFSWKADRYLIDSEFEKPRVRTHLSCSEGTQKPDEVENLMGLEYSHFIVRVYNVKVPSGWMVSILLENERVCLYSFNQFAIYLESFAYGMRLSFNPFIKDIFNHLQLALS